MRCEINSNEVLRMIGDKAETEYESLVVDSTNVMKEKKITNADSVMDEMKSRIKELEDAIIEKDRKIALYHTSGDVLDMETRIKYLDKLCNEKDEEIFKDKMRIKELERKFSIALNHVEDD